MRKSAKLKSGDENIFIFGMKTHEVEELKAKGYDPLTYYNGNADLKNVIDMISTGLFCPEKPELFRPITDSLLYHGDQYCVLADFAAYITCQQQVAETYNDQEKWTTMSILNVANMGEFSTDRTIQQYTDEIWGVSPTPIEMN